MPVLVLTTVGRRSGRPVRTPVVYLRDGDDYVVLPANAGSDRTPDWWLNLQAASSGTVLANGRSHLIDARAANPAEQQRLWPMFADQFPEIEHFRRFTARPLTFGVLTPRREKLAKPLGGAQSAALGEQRSVRTNHGDIHYRECGDGPVLLFVHGLWVNGDVWRKVVPLLADRYRCICPDWPFGAHRPNLRRDADMTPNGVARLFAGFIDALGLCDVTLLANDTGVAYAQVFVANHPDQIARLIITPGDVGRNFLAVGIKWMRPAGYLPGLITPIARMWNTALGRRVVIGALTKRLPSSDVLDSWFLPAARNAEIRRDLTKLLRAASPRATLAAEPKLRNFQGATLIVWTTARDPVFPLRHGRKLQRLIPGARLEIVADTRGFVSEDQPGRLAELVDDFCAS